MEKQEKFKKRKERRRKILKSRSERPRLVVFRSNKHIYAQIIDDKKGETRVSAWDGEVDKVKSPKSKVKNRIEMAGLVGEKLAEKAKKVKIKEVVFDRGGYKYHGQVKALAEGARKGGLDF